MQGMASALLCGPVAGSSVQKILRFETETLNGRAHLGPLLGKKSLAFCLQQQVACAGVDEHAETASLLDELLIGQLLIGFEDGERVDPILRRYGAHRRQGVAFAEHAIEDHGNDAVTKLAVNRLAIVPVAI